MLRKIANFQAVILASMVLLSAPSAHAWTNAWPATPGIKGTPHDLSDPYYSYGVTEICASCHVPHGANKDVQADAPLWSHNLTTATYTLYQPFAMKAAVGAPGGVSKLCLGCHDGTVAKDAFKNHTPVATLGTPRTDRRSSHPLSFTYDQTLFQADSGLWDPTTTNSGLGGTIDSDLLDHNHQVQCTSCHEPHNKYGINKYLRLNNEDHSMLCYACHNK